MIWIDEKTKHNWLVARGWGYNPETGYNEQEWVNPRTGVHYSIDHAVWLEMFSDIFDYHWDLERKQPIALITGGREVMQFDEQKPGIYLGQAKSRKAQAYEI